MTAYLFSLSLLICAVFIIRAAFRKTVSPRVIYALWLVIVLRMVLPVTLFSVETELPAFLRERFVLTETEGDSAKTEASGTKASGTEASGTEASVSPIPKEPMASQIPVPSAPVLQNNADKEAIDFPGQTAQASEQKEKTPAFAPEEAPKGQRDETPAGYPEETAAVSWRRIAGIVWISGSLLLAAWFAFTDITFQCRLRKERRPHRKIQGIRVYISGNAGVPCVAGWLPAIYLTPEAADSPAEPLILLHEYTHLRHGDPVWSVFRALALIVFWWNPLVWAAAVCSGRDAELACDDAVSVQLDDAQRLKYANTLLDTVPQKKSFALGFGSAPLRERILRLTKKRKNHVICVLLAVLLSVSAAGCSFAALRTPTAEENPVSEENTTPDTELSDDTDDAIPTETLSETGNAKEEDETPSAFRGPYFGYVKDAETDWIDLYPEKDGSPAARIPYEIFRDWAGMDRTAEGWTPGWMDGIAFYYAAFGETRWAAAHLQDTVLSVGRKLTALSRDGGETWTFDSTTDCGGNHVTCIGFADENTAFMGFDPIREFDLIPETPAVSRTVDGGKTWQRIDIPVPDYSEKKLFLPVSFLFEGAEGKLLLDVLDWDTRIFSERITAVTHDGGMTWEYRQNPVTVTERDGWNDETFSVLNYDGRISGQCRTFFDDLLSGQSAIPEYNALGIRDWSITRDDSLYGYYPAFRFTFTVTGNSLDTLPPGTYTRNVYDIRETVMEDPDDPGPLVKDRYPAQYETAAEAVLRLLRSRYNWYCAPFGEWSIDIPVNYIIYQSTQDQDSMPIRDFLMNAERLCGARLTEELIRSLYGSLVHEQEISAGGVGSMMCAVCTDAQEITVGRIAVTVQLYADYNGLLPSHLVQYEVSPDGVLYGCRLLKESPYPPKDMTEVNIDTMTFLPPVSDTEAFREKYVDTPEALSSLGLPDGDPGLSYIRAFISGDTAALEELCCVEKGVYESYGTLRLTGWKAWTEKDDRGVERLYFSFYPSASDVAAFPAGQWKTYSLSEGVSGVLLSDADGTGDTDRDASGEAAEAVGFFLRSTLIRELPDTVGKETPESFFLTCYICGRLHSGNEDITEASVKAYARDYFGIEDFQPDENHLKYGCAHGGAWQALTVTDVRDNADGTVSVTVQYYADRAKTVCSHIVMYTVEKIGTEWAFLEHEVIFRAPFEPFGYSM